jgi:hypothetical protein
MRLLLVLVVFVFVSGCGFTMTAPRDYALGSEPKDGIVVISFTHPSLTQAAWMYRDITKSKGIKGVYERIVSTGEHPDVSEPMIDGDTRMIAVVLPEGEYELYRWRAAAPFGYREPVKDFSVRFRSVAGRAVYIGNLLMPIDSKHFWLFVRDRRESEIPLFLKHYPKITDTQIETHLMHIIRPGQPLEASALRSPPGERGEQSHAGHDRGDRHDPAVNLRSE